MFKSLQGAYVRDTKAFILLLSCTFVTLGCSVKGNSGNTQRILVADVGRRTTLIGRLGQPLGTVVAIKGRWERMSDMKDPYALRLKVSSVNGNKLEEPVLFHIHLVEVAEKDGSHFPKLTPPNGDSLEMVEWNVRAIEHGYFELGNTTGIAMGLPAVGLPDYFETFTSQLVCIIE